MSDEEIIIAVVAVNFLSALWSYFCISASIDRTSRGYDFMHDTELAWHAFWTSCQTFALLVSFTNLSLLSYVAYSTKPAFVETVKSQPLQSRRAILYLLGVAGVAAMVPLSFIPYKLTLVQTRRMDENLFIHWDG